MIDLGAPPHPICSPSMPASLCSFPICRFGSLVNTLCAYGVPAPLLLGSPDSLAGIGDDDNRHGLELLLSIFPILSHMYFFSK
ncbi:hypothetical protein SETIT_4G093600v2 [Setaria italica]|uniref:Uncharacterized protein n=2 Tax=Setaria TaxID=4554 RepID=A0A368QSJ9_SETIT|nr:hypothetical protein SETIT_4G093600v2 [Setaria italica]TKW20506.1 hypothetical protein SEVIR_4G093300v2 [Setaria viridis]